MDFLKNLNPEQTKAVMHKDGPLLIVAGAGTGKTTVIAQRIAYLIEQGLAGPDEILALTFTEKAAGEMSDRVDSLLPYGYFDLWISTFHSFAERILKEHGLAIGLPGDFKLLNEFEQWALIKKNLDKFNLDYYRPLGNPTKFIRALLKHFSRAKDENIGPADYLAYAEGLKENLDGMLGGDAHLSLRAPLRSNLLTGRGAPPLASSGGNLTNGKQAQKSKASGLAMTEEEELSEEIAAQEIARLNEVANAYHIYQQLLLDNNALDFGDLINYCLKLFRDRPAILEKYRKQFKYILLDEFQDTNWSQYELIKILATPKNNLTVVGDDDQSIFRFRGASMSNILQFVKDYAATEKIVLTKNYRSRQNILDLSYEFIKQNNPNRLEWQLESQKTSVIPASGGEPALRQAKPESSLERSKQVSGLRVAPPLASSGGNDKSNKLNKKLIAQDKGQGVIEVIEGLDLTGEIESVVGKIMELKRADKTATWNDFAILVRANDSAVDFTLELDRRGLPYIFGASRGLYAKPVIMDVISCFKLLDNYHESAAVWRILNLPIFNFSDAELINFNHLAGKKAWSLFEVINHGEVFKFSVELTAKIKPVLDLVSKLTALAREKTAGEVFLAFMNQSGYLKYLTKQEERKSLETMGFLNQFLKRIKAFESSSDDKSVRAFLAELNLEMEAGEEGNLAADLEAGPEAVKILTVHGAKGLEFKYVFIANLVDKRFPTIARSEEIKLPDALVKEILPEGDVHLEEERRLFYVAMTRAKSGLYFSWAKDYGGVRKKKPSRFLKELGMVKGKASEKDLSFPKPDLPASDGRAVGNPEISQLGGQTATLDPRVSLRSPEDDKYKIIPSHFSYSQLAAYSNCPYQYRFAHILKIPVMGKEQFSFGKTMHAALEKLFALIKEKQELGQADLFSKAPLKKGEGGVITLEEILKLYDESWIDDWYESKEKKQERKKHGREILKVFYEKHKDNWPEVLYLEKGFNLKIAGDQAGENIYAVRGVIDRIDRAKDGLRLVDYKTGQPKKDLDFKDKEQLFIYQLAVEDLFKQPVSALVFYYLDNNSEVEFIAGRQDLEKVKAKIISTIEEIRRGDFPPRPSRLCAFCDFNGICEFRQ